MSDPVTITITVKDENDNMPVLTEEVFSGILSKGTKQGNNDFPDSLRKDRFHLHLPPSHLKHAKGFRANLSKLDQAFHF